MRWKGIVIHHTASPDRPDLDLVAIRRYHVRDRLYRDVGYHWMVECVGDHFIATMARPSFERGAHERKANRTHLGVALVGNFEQHEVPLAQLEECARLCASLCAMNEFGPEDITQHRDWKSTACPGELFPIETLKTQVRMLLGIDTRSAA